MKLLSSIAEKIKPFYEKQYKKLLIIPFLLLILALVQISIQKATTDDFLNRDVSLKGGVSVTLPTTNTNPQEIEVLLISLFPENDLIVRTLSSAGQQVGLAISIDIQAEDQQKIELFLNELSNILQINKQEFTVEVIGTSLGQSFFREVSIALLVAFLLMGIVVFIYFRTLIPSGAVILAAFSDIVVTLAIVNLLGMEISTAGIAAFLMLIGYSVDTDILLTTKVLKRREGSVMERVYSAIKTGLTMNITTMIALLAAIILTQSETIKQIMIILFIGLLVDMVNTWIQNTGILRLYLERKHRE